MRSDAAPRLRIQVDTDPPYEVEVGRGLLSQLELASEMPPHRGSAHAAAALIADARAFELHGDKLANLAHLPRYLLRGGEASKNLSELERVLEFLSQADLDRSSTLFAFGGGVTGDMGGLAASLFKRGIDVVQIPTTLLAQVDASIGGKTAVNLAAGKNLAGTVHQPRTVVADVDTLATLPEEEHRSGLGEVVKTALIDGEKRLAELEAQAAALVAREPGALLRTVADCVRIKARVVAADPGEADARRVLNLGHTFGHAIEHAAGYGKIPHGVAVAVGLMLSLRASEAAGTLEDPALIERLAALLERLGLPANLESLRASNSVALEPAALMAGFQHDKKGAVGSPRFVLPRRAGSIDLDRTLPDATLHTLLG